jgi:hypothetical protein
VSDKPFYLLMLAILMAFIASLLPFIKGRAEVSLNEGYLKATKTFQVRCENDGFVVLNETLYRCSKVTEVPSIDLELGE